MLRKLVYFACLCCSLNAEIPYPLAQSFSSAFYSQFDFFRIHSKSLFARSGELRASAVSNSVWINEEFGFLNHRDLGYALGEKNFFNNLSFGADTFFTLQNANLYVGGGLDIVSGRSASGFFRGDRGSYAAGMYLTYFHTSQFFVDVNAKYFYATQDLIFKNSSLNGAVFGSGSSNFYIGINVGRRFSTSGSPFVANFFFLEPSLSLESGYIARITNVLNNMLDGEMKGFAPLGLKANLAFGQEWNQDYKGSLKAGVSLEYDHRINGEITIIQDLNDPLKLGVRNDFRVGFFVEADFVLNQNFRFFFRSNSTFSGKVNTLYAMNVGMRYSFGKVTQHNLHSKGTINWNDEGLQ